MEEAELGGVRCIKLVSQELSGVVGVAGVLRVGEGRRPACAAGGGASVEGTGIEGNA